MASRSFPPAACGLQGPLDGASRRAQRSRPPMSHRERYLFVCTNRREEGNPKGSCAQKGSEELVKVLKAKLKERGVADRIRACASGCLDLCEIGASIVQEPDHVAYGGVR